MKRSLPRYQSNEKCVEKRVHRSSCLTTSRCFGKELFRDLYNTSRNESVFKVYMK